MSKLDDMTDEILDAEALDLIGGSIDTAEVDRARIEALRARVMQRIDGEPKSLFDTIRNTEGDWIEIAPLVEKKVLQVDVERGIESYLLRMHPGASVPQHHHDSDELCYVIEGDVTFGEFSLKSGDYHFARRGTDHGDASTVNGVLLFLQSGIDATPDAYA